LKLNNLDSASFYYTKGINGDTARNKSDVYRTIAEAYKNKKEYCKSGEWYDNLVKSNPGTQALDHFWCVVMYYYCRDYSNALRSAERFEEKYADQPSSIYWHARILSAIDSEATDGKAAPLFEKWLTVLGPENVVKPEKKNDVTKAYEYLLLYNFKKEDKEKTNEYKEKLRLVDANDGLLKQIEGMEKGGKAAPAPKKDTKPVPPPKKK
jgi:hypothetical protein